MTNDTGCPLDPVIKLLSGEWTVHIMWTLGTNGPTRFGELRRLVVGISAKVLTDRLRMLERQGLIAREEEKTVPPSVTYSLTSDGGALHQALLLFEDVARRLPDEDTPS